MKKIIKWRLKEPPSPLTLGQLVKDQLLTKEEAREILLSSETEDDRDKKSLESEIKFLRELVEKLSNGNATRIVEVIKEVRVPYYTTLPWYGQYQVWCTTAGNNTTLCNAQNNYSSGTNEYSGASNSATSGSFASIKTF